MLFMFIIFTIDHLKQDFVISRNWQRRECERKSSRQYTKAHIHILIPKLHTTDNNKNEIPLRIYMFLFFFTTLFEVMIALFHGILGSSVLQRHTYTHHHHAAENKQKLKRNICKYSINMYECIMVMVCIWWVA